MTGWVVDLQPRTATLLAYRGDPFDFHLRLTDADGQPVDVTGWDWRATVITGTRRIDFEWAAEGDGVRLWMRGDDTARLPANERRGFPYDVTTRQPDAGEGRTVLRGRMMVAQRVTDPLRTPDLAGVSA